MKKRKHPWMVIIAGPNGAGKSTFYDLVIKDDPLMKNAPFINMDNIAKEISEPDENPNDNMLSAGKITYEEVEKHLESRTSFVYETTSSGKVHLRFMDAARKKGFKIATVFIGLSDPWLSYWRVRARVASGGHDVPYKDLTRRYPKIMKNFPEMLKRSDIAGVFDNSGPEPFKLIFLMDDKAFRIFYKYPRWLAESIKERKTSKDMIIMRSALDIHNLNDADLQKVSDMALSAVIMGGEKDDLDIQLADRQTDNLAIARGKEPMPNISGMPIPPDAGDPQDKEKPRPATVRGGMNINDWLQKAKNNEI